MWKAHDARLDRMVAVKMLLRGALGPLSNDAGRERFRREALTLSRLSHPGIATVFDFDSEGDHDFLVMEFVPGGTLESRLREGPLPLDADPIARRRGRRRAGGRAPPRRPSSRPEAGECCADDGGAAEDPGLRPRAAPGGRRGDGPVDPGGHCHGLAGIYGARTTRGRGRRPANGRLRAWRHAVRTGHRTAAVYAGPAAGADVRDRQYAGPFSAIPPAGRHRRLRSSDCVLPREGPRAPACFGSGGRGSVAAAARQRFQRGHRPARRGARSAVSPSCRFATSRRIRRRNTSPTA